MKLKSQSLKNRRNRDQVLSYLNRLNLNDMVSFFQHHYAHQKMSGFRRRFFEQFKELINSDKTKLTISHEIADNSKFFNFVRTLDIDFKNYYNIKENKNHFINFENYRNKKKKDLNKNIFIKRNIEDFKENHLLQTKKLKKDKLIREIKLIWIIDNYGDLLDYKSITSITNFSQSQILELRNKLEKINYLRLSTFYKKFDENKLSLEDKFIKKEIKDTNERKMNLVHKSNNYIEETYLDVIKKGANLTEK